MIHPALETLYSIGNNAHNHCLARAITTNRMPHYKRCKSNATELMTTDPNLTLGTENLHKQVRCIKALTAIFSVGMTLEFARLVARGAYSSKEVARILNSSFKYPDLGMRSTRLEGEPTIVKRNQDPVA